jgi:hypothetical protein
MQISETGPKILPHPSQKAVLSVILGEPSISPHSSKVHHSIILTYNGENMSQSENKSLSFHNEGAVLRVALWSNIIAWVILVFAFISFAHELYQIVPNWAKIAASLPSNILERIAIFITQVFYDPLVGVFYFLVLRAVSQGLNLGLDLYYDKEEIEEAPETPAA